MIDLTLFGTADLRDDDGRPRHALVAQQRAFALLIYLAIAGPRPGAFHRRDRLVGLFWPESGQAQARANLRGLVLILRRELGEDVIEGRGDEELRLAPERAGSDVARFEEAIERGHLAHALELYRGELLPGFFLSGASEFERWLDARRMELAEKAADTAWTLATRLRSGNLTGAANWAVRAARLSFHNERRFRRALELLVEAEMVPVAIQLYMELERRLAELNLRPSPQLRKYIDDLRSR